jgi:hypothetical protein
VSPAARAAAVLALALPLAAACRRGSGDDPPRPRAAAPLLVPSFADATETCGVTFTGAPRPENAGYGMGAAALDYDGDGDLDIFLPQDLGPCSLYRNEGNWVFVDVAAAAGVAVGPLAEAKAAAAFDYDGDGWTDLWVGRAGVGNLLFRNRGDGTFEDVSAASGLGAGTPWTMSGAVGDFDGDGRPDLYECNFVPSQKVPPYAATGEPAPNRLWRNAGDGTFEDLAPALGLDDPAASWAALWHDLDGDLRPDLLVANDRAFLHALDPRDRAFRNPGAPGVPWTDGGPAFGLDEWHSGMGFCAGDFDGDGAFDLYASDLGASEMRFTGGPPPWPDLATALGTDFTVDALGRLQVAWGAAVADFDRDGRPDLLVMHGALGTPVPGGPLPDESQVPALFLSRRREPGDAGPAPGDPELRFEEAAGAAGLLAVDCPGARAALPVDLDGDGDLDLVVSGRIGRARFVRNDTPSPGPWYGVRLRGTASCREGWGATLELRAGDAVVRDLVTAGGQPGATLPPERLLVPPPRARGPVTLTVRWPSGAVQEVVPARDAWTLVVEP